VCGELRLMICDQHICIVLIVFQDDLCKVADRQDLYIMLPGIFRRGGYQVCSHSFAFMFVDFGVIDDHFMQAGHPVIQLGGRSVGITGIKAAASYRMGMLYVHIITI
jgi:hypothetical protein